MFDRVEAFVRDVRELQTEEALAGALADVSRDLGFRYFALTHHLDVRRSSAAIRIHNYPEGWAEWFDEQSLGATRSGPSREQRHQRRLRLVQAPRHDRRSAPTTGASSISRGRQGIGDGFTVPAHVPGEAHGSCSFAVRRGRSFLRTASVAASARRRFLIRSRAADAPSALCGTSDPADRPPARVRDLGARGKSDWEISRILGISHETVIEHLQHARERYGVGKRTLVAIHALFDGTIGFLDVAPP